jgi:hypothetical protein
MNRRNILKTFACAVAAFFVPIKVRASTVNGLPVVELKNNKVVNFQYLIENCEVRFRSSPSFKMLKIWLPEENALQCGCTDRNFWGEASLNISEYADHMFINISPVNESKIIIVPHCNYSIIKVRAFKKG